MHLCLRRRLARDPLRGRVRDGGRGAQGRRRRRSRSRGGRRRPFWDLNFLLSPSGSPSGATGTGTATTTTTAGAGAGAPPGSPGSSSEDHSGTDTSHVPTVTEQAAEKARLERIASKAHREAAEKATAHARKTVPIKTAHPSVNDHAHLAGLEPHIILDARKATGKESRYLSAIAKRFTDDKVRAGWTQYAKYFDGQSALERIALQEDVKRKEVWNKLLAMSEYLLCARHW